MLCASPGLRLTCHRKSAAQRKAFERCARVREDDRALRAVGVGFVVAHESRCLLTHQKRAECRVSKCLERHARVGFGNALAKNAGHPAVDVVHDERRRAEIPNDIVEEPLHGRRFACIAGVSANAVLLLQSRQDRFVRIPRGDGDTHAALREQPGATRADAGSAPDDECNVSYGGFFRHLDPRPAGKSGRENVYVPCGARRRPRRQDSSQWFHHARSENARISISWVHVDRCCFARWT